MIDNFDRIFCDPFAGCSMDCKHVYDKTSIMHYIATNPNAKCPIAGKDSSFSTHISLVPPPCWFLIPMATLGILRLQR